MHWRPTWCPAAVVGGHQVDASKQVTRELINVVGFGQAARNARQHHVVGRRLRAVHHRAGHAEATRTIWNTTQVSQRRQRRAAAGTVTLHTCASRQKLTEGKMNRSACEVIASMRKRRVKLRIADGRLKGRDSGVPTSQRVSTRPRESALSWRKDAQGRRATSGRRAEGGGAPRCDRFDRAHYRCSPPDPPPLLTSHITRVRVQITRRRRRPPPSRRTTRYSNKVKRWGRYANETALSYKFIV